MNNENENLLLTYASSIENVDFAMYEWLDTKLNLNFISSDGIKKAPVLWVTPERAFQVKQNKEFRDIDGTLNLPLITLERTQINKDQKNAGTFYANLNHKNNTFVISRRVNQKKTSEFINADKQRIAGNINFVSPKKSNKIVYEYSTFKLPVYAYFTYNVTIFTQFQQNMNELLQPFLSITGNHRYFLVERDGYKYECFIESNFDTKNNINNMELEERRYITTITIKTLANLVSAGLNEEDKIVKTYENPVETKFPKNGIEIK